MSNVDSYEEQRFSIQAENMIKLNRILFPTDFSQNANAARPYACSLAEQNGAELHLLHVISSPDFLIPDQEFLVAPNETWEAWRQAAEKRLAEAIELEWEQKLIVVRAVRKGAEFPEIVRYSRENNIDLIVMATHGRTGLMHIFLGSVAENVVRNAACPVMTVHPADHSFVGP